MVAVEGVYNNGKIELSQSAPVEKAKVIVLFPETIKEDRERLNIDAAKVLFHKFSGCLNEEIDEKAERLGALDEKYENIN